MVSSKHQSVFRLSKDYKTTFLKTCGTLLGRHDILVSGLGIFALVSDFHIDSNEVRLTL